MAKITLLELLSAVHAEDQNIMFCVIDKHLQVQMVRTLAFYESMDDLEESEYLASLPVYRLSVENDLLIFDLLEA